MGQTLEKPGAQVKALLVMGQLQSQSHSPLPSGQLHLHEHSIPSPPAGSGPPEPDPGEVGSGTGVSPDPDPVIGTGVSPDPDPVIGTGVSPDPDPVIGTGVSPDPDPVVGSVGTGSVAAVGASHEHFEILPFPFLTASVKEQPPSSTVPDPEHFLSHFAEPEHVSPILILKSHRQDFFPSLTFSFLNTSA